jgi:hypothetical protein
MDGPSNPSITEQWHLGGDFSLDASLVISGGDRRGRERLLRYCARPPFAGERLEWIDAERVRDRLPRPRPDVCGELIRSPPERIGRVAALVLPPRRHRLRYYGVLAANARLRPAVTAMAPEQDADACAPLLDTTTDEAGSVQAGARKARYRWQCYARASMKRSR